MTRFKRNLNDRIIAATVALNHNKIKFIEHKLGKIQIGSIIYYSNSETWKDTKTYSKGKGINTLIEYIKNIP